MTLWIQRQENVEMETLDGHLELTRAQSKSTASSISSWWPILDTPKSSSSWWVIRNSWSPPTSSLSKVLMYCWRQSSRPWETHSEDTLHMRLTRARHILHFPLIHALNRAETVLPFVLLQRDIRPISPHLQP